MTTSSSPGGKSLTQEVSKTNAPTEAPMTTTTATTRSNAAPSIASTRTRISSIAKPRASTGSIIPKRTLTQPTERPSPPETDTKPDQSDSPDQASLLAVPFPSSSSSSKTPNRSPTGSSKGSVRRRVISVDSGMDFSTLRSHLKRADSGIRSDSVVGTNGDVGGATNGDGEASGSPVGLGIGRTLPSTTTTGSGTGSKSMVGGRRFPISSSSSSSSSSGRVPPLPSSGMKTSSSTPSVSPSVNGHVIPRRSSAIPSPSTVSSTRTKPSPNKNTSSSPSTSSSSSPSPKPAPSPSISSRRSTFPTPSPSSNPSKTPQKPPSPEQQRQQQQQLQRTPRHSLTRRPTGIPPDRQLPPQVPTPADGPSKSTPFQTIPTPPSSSRSISLSPEGFEAENGTNRDRKDSLTNNNKNAPKTGSVSAAPRIVTTSSNGNTRSSNLGIASSPSPLRKNNDVPGSPTTVSPSNRTPAKSRSSQPPMSPSTGTGTGTGKVKSNQSPSKSRSSSLSVSQSPSIRNGNGDGPTGSNWISVPSSSSSPTKGGLSRQKSFETLQREARSSKAMKEWALEEEMMDRDVGGGYGDGDGDGDEVGEVFEDEDGLVTEVAELGEVDDEISEALNTVAVLHARRMTHYRRLLAANEANAATSLHALHAKIKNLSDTTSQAQAEAERYRRLANAAKATSSSGSISRANGIGHGVAGGAMNAQQLGGLDEGELRGWVRGLNGRERWKVLEIVLDACFSSDVWAMQDYLARYVKSVFDLVTNLPSNVAVKVLLELGVPDMLRCRLVSRKWHDLIRDHGPTIWRERVLQITASDPVRPPEPSTPEGWEPLYKGLHFRERNWSLGLAQEIKLMKGHTSFVTSSRMRRDLLITGSYDQTIRMWDLSTGHCTKVISVPGSISCIDFLPDENIVCAGCHDIGRVFVLSALTGAILQKLQGHNKGIKAMAMNDKYLVSAGQDKALVAWDWKNGKKVVRFGQQSNVNIGVCLIDADKIVSVQVDGVIRTFDITTRQMIGHFKPASLLKQNETLAKWMANLAATSTNVFMWLAASQSNLTLGTSDYLLYFAWHDSNGVLDLTRPPTLLSYIATSTKTRDLSVGVSDPSKRRVLTSTRFASRAGTDRRIYTGHFDDNANVKIPLSEGLNSAATVQTGSLVPIGGAWEQLAGGQLSSSGSATSRVNLADPLMNPLCMECDHERLVIGTAGGLVYSISFLGYKYTAQKPEEEVEPEEEHQETSLRESVGSIGSVEEELE